MSSFKKTGDIKGNTESLIRNLKLIKYPSQSNFKILSSGNPEIYLPIIHYSLFNYSSHVAKFLSDKNYDMYAKNDLDFINTAFKCLMTLFNYKPEINTNQFFSNGYAEGKVILCKEIIDIVLQKDSELSKKKKSNKYSKNIYKNENANANNNNNNSINNNNNNSPRFHELNESRNSQNKKKNNSNNNSNYMDENNNLGNNNSINNDDLNNINNNLFASLPMNNIPVPTPKPQNIFSKINNSNINYNNIQSSVQSFKPKTNNNMNQMEIYDSSQDFPLGGQTYDSSVNNKNQINSSINTQNSNNSMDFSSIIKVITSLSESVSQAVNKIEKFKEKIEDRLNKVEAEIVLIKNKQNYLESKLNNKINNDNNDNNNNSSINNKYLKENQKNNNDNNKNLNINLNKNNNNNYINSYFSNSSNKKDENINDSNNVNNINSHNNKNNQIFVSFGQDIKPKMGNIFDDSNNNDYYDQSINNNSHQNNTITGTGFAPYPEENKVYNVFSYTQTNENNFIDNNNYNVNNINDNSNNVKNKYADIDKLIENSEKSYFKTQKLLEDYGNTDISKK